MSKEGHPLYNADMAAIVAVADDDPKIPKPNTKRTGATTGSRVRNKKPRVKEEEPEDSS